jgi:hypothetical protein
MLPFASHGVRRRMREGGSRRFCPNRVLRGRFVVRQGGHTLPAPPSLDPTRPSVRQAREARRAWGCSPSQLDDEWTCTHDRMCMGIPYDEVAGDLPKRLPGVRGDRRDPMMTTENSIEGMLCSEGEIC